jgi:predicted ATP-binding protein involved in virulence
LPVPSSENMKIKSLKIQSFRGIKDLTLEFDSHINVFIGINGVGKSSILECLATLLSRLAALIESPNVLLDSNDASSLLQYKIRAQHDDNHLRVFTDQDINHESQELRTTIAVDFEAGETTPWTIIIRRSEKYYPHKDELKFLFEKVVNLKQKFLENKGLDIPIAVYYSTNRNVQNVLLEAFEYYPQPPDAYIQAFTDNSITFEDFFKWFRTIEDLENEKRRDDSVYSERQLDSVRKAILKFLPDFSNLRVRRFPLRMTVSKQGKELIVNQLSDGEKCLLAMVGDLARRLAIANPGLDDPLQGEGVVLIDEIELHLHPQWQRGILPKLTTTFPNCQFIVTTHSPQVISDVKPENIIILEATALGEVTARHPQSSYGRDSNQILEDIMDVPQRPQHIQNEIQQLFRLIAMGHLENARNLHDNLVVQIGSDEPELVGARAAIQRKELLGK